MLKKVFILALLLWSASFAISAQSDDERTIAEIKKLDRLWQVESYSSKDLKDFDRIVAEDFQITAANGKILTKAEKRQNVKADYTEQQAPDAVFKIEETNHKVRIFDDVAISTGYIIEKYVYQGNQINSRVYFTCTYLKRKNTWQVVAAHYSRINQK